MAEASQNSATFEDDRAKDTLYVSRQVFGEPVKPGMINFVKSKGFAKTDAQAYIVLIATAAFCLLVAAGLIIYFVFGVGTKPAPAYRISPQLKAKLPLDAQQKINQAQHVQTKK